MRLILILGLICSFNAYGQNDSCILIRYPNYKTVIYQSNYTFKGETKKDLHYAYQVPYGKSGDCKPWTPTTEQVKKLESNMEPLIENYIVHGQLDSAQIMDLGYIIQNITNYNRRYFSCLDKHGTKIIYIMFDERNEDDNLDFAETELFQSMGGGTGHFSLTYNFDSKKLVDLFINAPW